MQYYDNRNLVMELFILFTRFEYALKRMGYVKGNSNYVRVKRDKFAKSIQSKFDPEGNKDLKSAVDYISKNPPKKQIFKDDRLQWKEQPILEDRENLVKLLKYIATVRNNLFHGGKFPKEPFREPARNKKILNSSIVILKEIIEYNDKLKNYFNDDFIYEDIV